MKLLVTEKAAKLNIKDKKRLKKYWKTIYPKKYVDVLVTQENIDHFLKSAEKKPKNISLTGTLKQNSEGFVYIDIPDDFLFGLFKLLDEGEAKKPPYFGKGSKKVGAHISVMNGEEVEENGIKKITELGKEYDFELGKLKSVDPEGWNEMSQVYFLEVKCPELEKLRQKYKLPKKIRGHEFHITFGIEKE
tara:strand:- start:17388 stop:17957 length:570 start_codon:yes stop_codon:yes gene_type:complete